MWLLNHGNLTDFFTEAIEKINKDQFVGKIPHIPLDLGTEGTRYIGSTTMVKKKKNTCNHGIMRQKP